MLKEQKIITTLITKVVKRNKEVVNFELEKIINAVNKALIATGEGNKLQAKQVANSVYIELLNTASKRDEYIPNIEEIQNLTEKHLMRLGFEETAKAYIIYRKEHSDKRIGTQVIPQKVKDYIIKSSKYFHTPYEEFIYYMAYSKWMDDKGRRETWVDTVDRTINFMHENIGEKLTTEEYQELKHVILNHEVMPSMRHIWTAGKAARECNACIYNCAYVAPTRFKDLGEIMYLSMSGCGVGFSVESKTAQQFPIIKKQTGTKALTHIVGDSKEGWASSFVLGMETWFKGNDIDFDYSQVREKGERLKTMGGRASGPQPLVELMNFAKTRVFANQGKRLSNIELHDIICKIGEIVVAGGVRRSAMISLSDLDDAALKEAKHGAFWATNPQRSLSNNSAVYEEKPDAKTFLEEWLGLVKSGTGERGIFNRGGLKKQLPKRRWAKVGAIKDDIGSNPCGEIYLKSRQFCNLSSIVIREEDTEETLLKKIKWATVLGTYQASLTNFKYLSKEWKENSEEEALLGVSFTGYFDNKVVRDGKVLKKLKKYAIKVNKEYSKRFKINQATAVTAVKPHGNSGQMLYVGSGMHPRYSKYYIRRVRLSSTDSLFKMLRDQGVPYHPEVGQNEDSATTFVLDFPVKSPDSAIVKDDVSALNLLENWKLIKENYSEHNVSVTIYVGTDEWLKVGNWVYENWEIIGGLAFLPRSEHLYQLAPYEEISEEKYKELSAKIPKIDFSKLIQYEQTDNTQGAKELACVGDKCEI